MCAARYIPHLLFVTYGGGHADIVARLWAQLEMRTDIRVTVLALTTAGGLLERHSIPYKRVLDYLPMEGYVDACAVGGPISSEIWDPTSGIPEMESCAYLGVSMLDLIRDHGEVAAYELYRRMGRHSFCQTHFMAQVLKVEKPDVVIVTCAVRMELATLITARRMGIASVLIEDLFGYSVLGDRQIQDGRLVLDASAMPEHVVTMNEAVRSRIVSAGFPAERVHALGQPVFAEWIRGLATAPVAAPLTPAYEAHRAIITYIAPARRDVLHEQTDAVLALARRWAERTICIKLHPSVGTGEFMARHPVLPANIVLLRDEDIVSVIRATSVALVFRSTVGLLCLFAGTPLLILDATGESDVMPYVTAAGVSRVQHYTSLADEVEKLLLLSSREDTGIRNPLFEVIPDASARIATFLDNLAQERRLNLQ